MTTEERISALTGAVQTAREAFARYAEIHDEKLQYLPTNSIFQATKDERKKVEAKRDANLALAKWMQGVLDTTKEI